MADELDERVARQPRVVRYLVLPSVGFLSTVGLTAAAAGAGQGCFLAAVLPIVNSLVPEADRRQVFARCRTR